MKNIYTLCLILLSIILLNGCGTNEKNVSSLNHSDMEHSETAKPLPDTSEQEEVVQQIFVKYVNYWHNKDTKGENVKVAILDTGVDIDNKDLSLIEGINFVGSDRESFDDDNGHGTKISGIIAAKENNYNLLGIAPNSELYIAKIANEHGNVKYENLIKGINWAVEQNVDLINISLEFWSDNNDLHDAIKRAYDEGIIIISSSGNIKHEDDTDLSYPGSYPEVINVGMLNTEGEVYSEEFNEKRVDVFAPGEDIFSLYLNDKMTLDTGVSFSTAYVSGYVALLIQSFKESNESYDLMTIKQELNENLQ